MKRTVAVLVAAFVSLSLLPLPSPAEAPAHATASGGRNKIVPTYVGFTGKKWPNDYGIAQGRCDRGAAAAVSSNAEVRTIAIVLGTAPDHAIGKEMDAADRACMGHALELASVRQTVQWTNPATGVSYRLTPTGAFKDGALTCRRFTTVLASGKKKESVKGAACRQGTGEWVFRSA